jgi:hypothetical protein
VRGVQVEGPPNPSFAPIRSIRSQREVATIN